MFSDYFKDVERKIEETRIIAEKNIDCKEFSSDEGMIRGKLLFINGYMLEFMEYVCIGKERPKYRFHLMDKDGKLLFRYDNAPHHHISSFPHHKHLPEEIGESKEKGLIEVLKEIEMLVLKI